MTMLDINLFRDQPDVVRDALRRRGEDVGAVDAIRDLDARRRAILSDVEVLRAERNRVSKVIGQTRDAGEREGRIVAMREVNIRIDQLETELASTEAALTPPLEEVPNIPRAD